MQLYTYQVCKEKALLCINTTEFRKYYKPFYRAAVRNKWLIEITTHFVNTIQPKSYWTYDVCKKEASKYKNRAKFKKEANAAYLVSKKQKWLEEFFPLVYNYLYCGYVIFNKRLNKAYVGITKNFQLRINEHKNERNSTNSKEIVNLPDTEILQLSDYTVSYAEAKKFEISLYKQYQNSKYEMLNSVQALGALGVSNPLWTLEYCKTRLEQIIDYKDLKTKDPTLLAVLIRKNWRHLAPHVNFPKSNNYWTKEQCLITAKKFITLKEFKRVEPTAYATMSRGGWLDELKHILISAKPNGFWEVKENCIKEAKKYSSRSEFATKAVAAYAQCRKRGWLEEACNHMKILRQKKA